MPPPNYGFITVASKATTYRELDSKIRELLYANNVAADRKLQISFQWLSSSKNFARLLPLIVLHDDVTVGKIFARRNMAILIIITLPLSMVLSTRQP
jgi:hypothetical protein